jgi:hypothetical protein
MIRGQWLFRDTGPQESEQAPANERNDSSREDAISSRKKDPGQYENNVRDETS